MITKKCALTLGGFALTMLICFVTMHVMELFTLSKWVGVGVASGIFVIMLITAVFGRHSNVLPFFIIPINAIGDGLALSSLYVFLGAYPEVWETAVIFGALMLAMLLYCLLTDIRFLRNHYIISMLVYIVLLLSALIIAATVNSTAKYHPQIFFLAFLSMIPFISFFITMAKSAENAVRQVKNMAIGSFAALILIVIVVLIVISQGEGLDGLGDGLSGAGVDGIGGSRKRNPYDFTASFSENIPD